MTRTSSWGWRTRRLATVVPARRPHSNELRSIRMAKKLRLRTRLASWPGRGVGVLRRNIARTDYPSLLEKPEEMPMAKKQVHTVPHGDG